ncbi:MAG: HPr family phosphocarrier protein [Aquisalinus sp.]|nr:HPr family phosphocarrier protein [Aquisalinus sp.]
MTSILTRDVEITNKRGLHARASAKFCAVAGSYEAAIRVRREGVEVGGCSIMGLMMLGAGIGSSIRITAEGPQAAEALDTLVRLVEERFGEDE